MTSKRRSVLSAAASKSRMCARPLTALCSCKSVLHTVQVVCVLLTVACIPEIVGSTEAGATGSEKARDVLLSWVNDPNPTPLKNGVVTKYLVAATGAAQCCSCAPEACTPINAGCAQTKALSSRQIRSLTLNPPETVRIAHVPLCGGTLIIISRSRPDADAVPSSSSSSPLWLYVGIGVGAAAALAIAVVCFVRRRKHGSAGSSAGSLGRSASSTGIALGDAPYTSLNA
jgi:hypothetical protein